MVIEAWHTNNNGLAVDLVNELTGDVIFPFSNGSIVRFYFNSDEIIEDEDTISDENNTDGNIYYSFFKLNEWKTIGVRIPSHSLSMFHMLKIIKNKYITYNGERSEIKDIIIDKQMQDFGVAMISVQLLLNEYSVTGNY